MTDIASRTALCRIETLTARIAKTETARQAAVAAAMAAGATWAEIGHALGVSAQAAHKRNRWLRASADGTETWHEPPLPL